MMITELKAIIQAAGGKCWALEYADPLLEKINRLEAASKNASLFTQLRRARESGDLRGRVLEVNFADLFVQKGIALQYGAKQGRSGDVDFCWHVNGDHVFIEMKRLSQDHTTKEVTEQQLKDVGCFATHISDDTKDVARIQRDIFLKSSTHKFNPKPDPTWINLVAIDVSELQLGTVDIGDCLLAACGNDALEARRFHHAFRRHEVVGVFEPAKKTRTAEQTLWVKKHHCNPSAGNHPRDYIHGILFLFREPKEPAALSYGLSGEVIWNPALIDHNRAASFLDAFHQIVPRAEFKSC